MSHYMSVICNAWPHYTGNKKIQEQQRCWWLTVSVTVHWTVYSGHKNYTEQLWPDGIFNTQLLVQKTQTVFKCPSNLKRLAITFAAVSILVYFCSYFPFGYHTLHLRVWRYKLINEPIIMQHIVGQLLYIRPFLLPVRYYNNKEDSKCWINIRLPEEFTFVK